MADERDANASLLSRLQAIDDLLPTLAGALDVRQVFERVSEIARRVIPHDMLRLMVLTADGNHLVSLAASDGALEASDPMPIPDSHRHLLQQWEHQIIGDIERDLAERDSPAGRSGYRSLLRVPIRVAGDLAAGLGFYSRQPHAYGSEHAVVARRIAEHIALTLSHARLAEEARRAAALEERASSLAMLDGLLATLAGVLDIREVFERVSEITRKVIPHDIMSLLRLTDDRNHLLLHAITAEGTQFPQTIPLPEHHRAMLDSHWEYVIDPDMQAHPLERLTPPALAGYRSRLLMPVRVAGVGFAAIDILSRQVNRYTAGDVLVARRIADHVALAMSHQRLAEQARKNEELQAREARLALLDELLATATDTGELKDQFDRISEIARKVLPHDAMTLPVLMPDGVHVRAYAFSGLGPAASPEIVRVPEALLRGERDHDLISDLLRSTEAFDRESATQGFRSALRVTIRLEGRLAGGLGFLSRALDAFQPADVLVARRIAARVALALSKELRADATARADEAQQRAGALEARVQALAAELNAVVGHRFVVGQSPSWSRVLKQATQVAATDTTTLLLGESGTGKEVVARFVHRASARSGGPFVALNCAALPEPLLESELFGFERGAFTGALQSKPGQIEQANGGVLFLDEVGEMSPSVQAKFLRVLQEREFQRLGGTRTLKANVRIVAATNRNLRGAVERGTFREDLYYRLNVFEIQLPPLRERADDILPLSEAFLKEIARTFGRPPAGIAREARHALLAYRWPGNVRELRNVLERAAILCEGGLITTEHLTFAAGEAPSRVPDSAASVAGVTAAAAASASTAPDTTDLRVIEKTTIERALVDAKHNKSLAAKRLGLTRKQLYVRLRQHGLD